MMSLIVFFLSLLTALASTNNCTSCQTLNAITNQCANCTANTYCQGGAVSQFPQYTVSPSGSSSLADCVCPQNAYLSNGVCMCSSGFLLVGLQCLLCPANSYLPDQNTQKQCTNNALSILGQSSPTGCNACPSGYVQNSPTNAPISCRPCDLGYACPNVTAEALCPAGTYAPPLATACLPCHANSYAAATSSACTPCSANAAAPPGSQSVAACVCLDGWYMDFYNQCLQCPAGYVCVNVYLLYKSLCSAGSLAKNT